MHVPINLDSAYKRKHFFANILFAFLNMAYFVSLSIYLPANTKAAFLFGAK